MRSACSRTPWTKTCGPEQNWFSGFVVRLLLVGAVAVLLYVVFVGGDWL
jgi:tetrahydromethanopterin S-methyltransferase subunit B